VINVSMIKTLKDLEKYCCEESARRFATIPEWAKTALPNDCVMPQLEAQAYTRIADEINHREGAYSRVKDLSDVPRACQEDIEQLTRDWGMCATGSYQETQSRVKISAVEAVNVLLTAKF